LAAAGLFCSIATIHAAPPACPITDKVAGFQQLMLAQQPIGTPIGMAVGLLEEHCK